MGGSTEKFLKRSLGVLSMSTTLPIAMFKHGGDVKKAVDDSYNLMSKGREKAPEAAEAPDVTGSLSGAIEEEDARRRKKRGFANNVLTSEFRFGGGNNNTPTGGV